MAIHDPEISKNLTEWAELYCPGIVWLTPMFGEV